jgi:calcineurin-like phosphoesterase family protein
MKIQLLKNQRLFFASDTHYFHTNICEGVSNWGSKDKTRPFQSLDEMNDTMVQNINSVVGEDDILFHLGDWSFGGFERIGEFRNRINCRNIHLIIGNHDHHIERDRDGVRSLFSSVKHYHRLSVVTPNGDKFSFVLMHFPIASWDGMGDGTLHLHGHVHLSPQHRIAEGRAMDVGMDGNGMFPISMEEVVSLIGNRPIKGLKITEDHHS